MTITAKELAKKLNLSESAVSLALNNKPGVSTQTRKRVQEAAETLGYDFSRIRMTYAPAAPNGSIYFVIYRKNGAVVTDTPFFSQLSEGIDAGCKKYHYYLNINYLYEGSNIEKQLTDWQCAGAKGIILLGTEMTIHDLTPFIHAEQPESRPQYTAAQNMKNKLPLVLLDNYFEDLNLNSVLINNIQGAYSAASYLIHKYRTQPGYLRSSYPISNFDERADGFYKAIRKCGMSPSRSIVHMLTPSMEGAYSDMLELIHSGEPLAECYFADNDLIAAGAMRAFRESGLRIPKDAAVIGFDDMPFCTYIEPALTTIHVPKQYMGTVAVRRLHELIEESDAKPYKIEISTSLIKRKSA